MQGIEKREGKPPPALQNRKVPNQWSIIYWKAYQELSGSRTWSQGGPSEIPYTPKILWLNENGVFDEDDRNDILHVIQKLDTAYLEHVSKKLERTK